MYFYTGGFYASAFLDAVTGFRRTRADFKVRASGQNTAPSAACMAVPILPISATCRGLFGSRFRGAASAQNPA